MVSYTISPLRPQDSSFKVAYDNLDLHQYICVHQTNILAEPIEWELRCLDLSYSDHLPSSTQTTIENKEDKNGNYDDKTCLWKATVAATATAMATVPKRFLRSLCARSTSSFQRLSVLSTSFCRRCNWSSWFLQINLNSSGSGTKGYEDKDLGDEGVFGLDEDGLEL